MTSGSVRAAWIVRAVGKVLDSDDTLKRISLVIQPATVGIGQPAQEAEIVIVSLQDKTAGKAVELNRLFRDVSQRVNPQSNISPVVTGACHPAKSVIFEVFERGTLDLQVGLQLAHIDLCAQG